MDEIQKVLIKAGRKDLAQKYYKKANPLKNDLREMVNKFGTREILLSLSDVMRDDGDSKMAEYFKNGIKFLGIKPN
jgi:hypothetical protein